ncbi:hypothetical protein ACGFIK_04250 [Micromonospora sp. NPDC048871]|uniref:hypothetical protein n=1 Tax=unclassified Micromonospora TaxID=2617518 RepID=UPI002E0F5DAF|nr:hypothetical protein OIE53_18075 [Micromonospora sp. NBC_01739]
MRLRSLLLPSAGLLFAVHLAGVLTSAPILRHAEVLAVALILAYALVVGLPSPRWVVPAGLVVVAVDAWSTMPVDPAAAGYRWHVLEPGPPPEFTEGLWTGLELTWAALVFVLLLALVNRRATAGGRPRTDSPASGRLVIGLLLAGGPVLGYAVFRVVEVRRNTMEVELADQHDGQPGTEVLAAAVLAPLALALAALLLAALLLGQGRRRATGGAVLLVVAALFHIDAALAPYTLLPLSPTRGTVFTGAMVSPILVMAPALAVAAELTGYLLLVAGLRPDRPDRHRAKGDQPRPAIG